MLLMWFLPFWVMFFVHFKLRMFGFFPFSGKRDSCLTSIYIYCKYIFNVLFYHFCSIFDIESFKFVHGHIYPPFAFMISGLLSDIGNLAHSSLHKYLSNFYTILMYYVWCLNIFNPFGIYFGTWWQSSGLSLCVLQVVSQLSKHYLVNISFPHLIIYQIFIDEWTSFRILYV